MRLKRCRPRGSRLKALCIAAFAIGVLPIFLSRILSLGPFRDTAESPCRRLARKQREDNSPLFQQRHQKIDPNGLPYAYFRWKGEILRSDFEKGLSTGHRSITIKILNNQLYRSAVSKSDSDPKLKKDRVDTLLNLIQFTLHLFNVPDLEMTVYFDDVALCGLPLVYYNIHDRCGDHGGFTFPSYSAFKNAFGPVQFDAFVACLDRRYPFGHDRIMKAVWRGSTTGSPLLTSSSNLSQVPRIYLASMGVQHPDVLDVGITKYVQDILLKLNEEDAEIRETLAELSPLRTYLSMDDFNRYAVVLDVDGNAWSDRFSRLIYSNTPILKQTSPWKEFFAHLVEQRNLTIPVANDLSDLLPVVHRTLQQYQTEEGREQLKQQITDRRVFAAEFLSQFAILRATAYTMTVYSQKQTWNVTIGPGDLRVTPDTYNSDRQRYPKGFVDDVFRSTQHR